MSASEIFHSLDDLDVPDLSVVDAKEFDRACERFCVDHVVPCRDYDWNGRGHPWRQGKKTNDPIQTPAESNDGN